MSEYNKYQFADAVFEGGGVKGIAFVGALKVMEEAGFRWKNVAGTSAGAIIASLVAVGYTASEIKELFKDINYKKMMDRNFWGISIIDKFSSLAMRKGLYKGKYMQNWINDLLMRKCKDSGKSGITFGDLIIKGEKGYLLNNPKYKRKYKLHIIAADITRGKMIILPEDIEDYGINPDELDVSLAVRMSASIPFFFEPVYIYNKIKKCKSAIIDGGILSNYPVWIFDVKGVPNYPTIGFRLEGDTSSETNHKTSNMFNFGLSIIETILDSQDYIYTEDMNYLRTIKIDTMNIKSTDFQISDEKIDKLYLSGEKCAKSFLKIRYNDYVRYLNRVGVKSKYK